MHSLSDEMLLLFVRISFFCVTYLIPDRLTGPLSAMLFLYSYVNYVD